MPRNIPIVILTFLFILVSFVFGRMLTEQSYFFPLVIIISLIVAFVTFLKPENGLMILVFSMLLSPQIEVARVPGREVSIRVDDILIIVVFLAWLAYTATNKDWKGFVITPLDKPLLLITAIYVTSTTLSILQGHTNPLKGFFYGLKYLEYFILYWITSNIISHIKTIPRYLIAGLITCIIVTIYAYSLIGNTPRVYAPFDHISGEPASLGGYYLVIFAVLFSFVLHAESALVSLPLVATIVFMMPPFVKTLSRASYLAFVPLLLTLVILTKKRKLIFILSLAFGALLFPIVFSTLYTDMTERIAFTFNAKHTQSNITVGGAQITDMSTLERIGRFKEVVQNELPRNFYTFFFGNGVAGLRFLDGQFFLVLGETGIIGTIIFYWIVLKIFICGYRLYQKAASPLVQALALALVACIVALNFQSFGTNTFIIVRIMEPFWFLTAIVVGVLYSQEMGKTSADIAL